MKKLILSFLGLLLGWGLSLGQPTVTISGNITVQLSEEGATIPADLKIGLGKNGYGDAGIIGDPYKNTANGWSDFIVSASASSYSGGIYLNNNTIRFCLATGNWVTYDGYMSEDWVFLVDGAEHNPYVYTVPPDTKEGASIEVNLVVAPKGSGGGGGEETPKGTLLGKVALGGNYFVEGVNVSISGANDFTKFTTTAWGEDYSSKLDCPYGYKFENLDLGTYTLTYSKTGYETKTQEVTVGEGENLAPAVSLEALPAQYLFKGTISYINTNERTVYAEGADVTAYDGDGADARVLGTATTDKDGDWQMTLTCKQNQSIYFWAEHPGIVVASRKQVEARDPDGQIVDISCVEKLPDLLPVETYTAKQIGMTEDGARVQISWTYPQEFLEKYKTASNPDGVYRLRAVKIFRPVPMRGVIEVGQLEIPEGELPGTTFVDGDSADFRLTVAPGGTKEYTYAIRLCYSKPIAKDIDIPGKGEKADTITLTFENAAPDSVTLTLTPNNPDWGTVEGTGRYEKGAMPVIIATANAGYRFKEWQKDNATYSDKARTSVKLTEDLTLTAVFEEKPIVRDSVNLKLEVNDTKMGTVTGEGRYPKGEEVTVTATPNSGYAFKQWKSGTKVLATTAEYKLTLNTDSILTAFFERKITYRAMINCSARQIDAQSVRLDWAWPQELVDEYKTAERGIYQISAINITRKYASQQTPDVIGTIRPTEFQLPVTYYVDNNAQYPLIVDTTYIYSLSVVYDKPDFTTVYVNDNGTDPNLSVKVAEEVAPVQYYTLTLGVNGEEKGTASASGASNQYMDGDQVTITATPKPGYLFQCWKEGETEFSTKNPHTFNIDRSMELTAVFVAEPEAQKVTLTLGVNDAEMGTVRGANIGANEYVEGATVTLTAVPNEGYVFKVWKEGEQEVHDQAVYTFTLSQDRTLTAVFDVKPADVETEINIVLSVNDTLMGTVTGEGKYPQGTQVTVTATPKTGYLFKGWKEDNQMLNAGATYVFMAQKDRSLEAVFAAEPVEPVKDSFELTLLIADSTMGTVQGTGKYEEGTPVDIKAIANEGYVFVAWMSGEDTVVKTAEHKITLVSDSTLTAVFAKDEEPVIPSANEDREQAAWSVYAQDGQIVLRSNTACQYDVYNMAGVLVKRAGANANEYRIAVDNSGLYIVRRISATGVSVKKVMVR